MRKLGTESGSCDANRQRVLDPRFRRVALLECVASDPLNGPQPAELCGQQIADREVLDFPVATYSSDRRTLREAVCVSLRATISDEFIVSAICRSRVRFRDTSKSSERHNSAHLHEVRRVRCVPEAKFSNSLVMVLPLQACAIQIRYIILFGFYMRNKFKPVCPWGRVGGFRAALFAAYAERAAVFRDPRQPRTPSPPKPISIIAQVEGSGTADAPSRGSPPGVPIGSTGALSATPAGNPI